MNYGGGGFMPGSQGNSPGAGKKQGNNSYRAVTIRQLLDAYQAHADAEFKVDDVDLDHVTVVGNITSLQKGTTNLSANIEDGTGSIDVRMWVDAIDEENPRMKGIEQGAYVRAFGTLKSFANKRSINATVVRPVEDFNEVQYHLLEAIHNHLRLTRGPPPEKGAAPMQGVQRTEKKSNQDTAAYTSRAGLKDYAVGDSYDHLKAFPRKVIHYVEGIGIDNLPAAGISIDAIASGVNATVAACQEVMEELLAEGLLYTTCDDDHYLPTAI